MAKSSSMEGTKALMGALVRMKPKPHEEMKVGKSKGKPAKKSTPKNRRDAAGNDDTK